MSPALTEIVDPYAISKQLSPITASFQKVCDDHKIREGLEIQVHNGIAIAGIALSEILSSHKAYIASKDELPKRGLVEQFCDDIGAYRPALQAIAEKYHINKGVSINIINGKFIFAFDMDAILPYLDDEDNSQE